MPARIQPTNKASNPSPDGPEADFRKAFSKHAGVATRVALEHRRGRPRMLDTEVRWDRLTTDTDEDVIADVTRVVFEAIERDADGGPWTGRAYIYNDNAERRATVPLETVDLRIDGGEVQTRDGEATAMLAACTKFVEGVTKQVVAILAATAGERQSVADLVGRVAKHDSHLVDAVGKWGYKKARDEQETERMRIREENKTHRSSTRWDNIEQGAEKFHDVIKSWSDFLLDGAKAKEKASAPTQADIDAVFAGEAFDTMRALASEMLATPDRDARMQLAADFKAAGKKLDAQQKATLQLRALQVMGEARARAAFAWLTNPRQAAR